MPNNPLFNLLGGNASSLPQGMQGMLANLRQFRNSFRGNPREQVQQMLNSGQITQEQYNKAVKMANELCKYV